MVGEKLAFFDAQWWTQCYTEHPLKVTRQKIFPTDRNTIDQPINPAARLQAFVLSNQHKRRKGSAKQLREFGGRILADVERVQWLHLFA